MSAKKSGLGKGLSALLPDENIFAQQPGEQVLSLAAEQIHANPDQPRKSFDADKLAELTESIRQHGVLQPLVVKEDAGGGYLIVAGERRYRSALAAGLTRIPCLVRQLSPEQVAELSLLENIQREDLTPLEEAEGYQSLIANHGYTQEQLAQRLGKSRPHVANTLRLLQLLPQERQLLAAGKLSAGHARALLSLNDTKQRILLCSQIVSRSLSVRQAEALAQSIKEQKPKAPVKTRTALLHQELARDISHRTGVKVDITGRGSRGRVVMYYNSEEDLQNILDALAPAKG